MKVKVWANGTKRVRRNRGRFRRESQKTTQRIYHQYHREMKW